MGIALVERQQISNPDQPKYLCLWASFPSIIWRNSRWGCRSVTLQQKRLRLCPIYCSWRFLFFFQSLFFFSFQSLWSQYLWIGKTNMEQGVDQHIKCQGLVRKALNLHHYNSSSREMVGLIQTIYAQLEGKTGLSF